MAVSLYPFFYGIYMSLTKASVAKVEKFVGLSNYWNLFTDLRFLNALGLTLLFVFGATFIELIIGTLLALLLNRETRLAKTARLVLTIPMMMTPIVVGITWRLLYDTDYGLINYILSRIHLGTVPWLASPSIALFSLMLVDSWQWTPFIMLSILAGLRSLPLEPYEAASIDGGSKPQIFRYITLPLLSPVILVAILVRTIDATKSFDIFFATTLGGPGTSTEIASLLAYKIGFRYSHMGYASAMAMIMLFVTIGLSTAFIRLMGKRGAFS
jgi:multiple sugar transport system permease protein